MSSFDFNTTIPYIGQYGSSGFNLGQQMLSQNYGYDINDKIKQGTYGYDVAGNTALQIGMNPQLMSATGGISAGVGAGIYGVSQGLSSLKGTSNLRKLDAADYEMSQISSNPYEVDSMAQFKETNPFAPDRTKRGLTTAASVALASPIGLAIYGLSKHRWNAQDEKAIEWQRERDRKYGLAQSKITNATNLSNEQNMQRGIENDYFKRRNMYGIPMANSQYFGLY